MQSYLSSGDRVTRALAAGETATSGELFSSGGFVGIAQADGDGDDGDSVVFLTRGIFTLTKTAAASAFVVGQPVYADGGDADVSHTALGPLIGYCVEAVAAAAADVDVMLAAAVAPGVKRTSVIELDVDTGIAIGVTSVATNIPAGARIVKAWYSVETTFTSATDAATISIGIETDDVAGILAAVAINDGSNPFDAGAFLDGIQTGEMADASEATAAAGRDIDFTVAVEALTAGRLQLFLEWMVLA